MLTEYVSGLLSTCGHLSMHACVVPAHYCAMDAYCVHRWVPYTRASDSGSSTAGSLGPSPQTGAPTAVLAIVSRFVHLVEENTRLRVVSSTADEVRYRFAKLLQCVTSASPWALRLLRRP